MEVKDVIRRCATQHAEEARHDFYSALALAGRRCESPIEKMLCAALVLQFIRNPDVCRIEDEPYVWPEVISRPYYNLVTQAVVGKYRTDFMIVDNTRESPVFIAIECDGHNFHERTKEQAAKDRSRDRWMTARGIKVLRFTGAEIVSNPLKCADQATDVMYGLEALDP